VSDELPETPWQAPADGTISTGFEALDAILGSRGLPRSTCVGLRGDGSSGKTTLALRTVAQAQASGSIVAWLDLTRSFDPVEAVARGVSLDWLVIVTPADLDEGLSIAGALLNGRAVDVLVLDLPAERTSRPPPGGPRIGDRLHRLAALARRAESVLVLLEPPVLPTDLRTAVSESAGLRLELERRSWLRLGRDVVGQLTEAVVARNRFGPPGRRAELRILYADGDEREACLWRDELVRVETSGALRELADVAPSIPVPGTIDDATSPPLLATPPSRSRPRPLRLVPEWTGHRRRPAVDRRGGHRRRPARKGTRRPAGNPARERSPARA
jgi:RecA/RadA recombinase